MAEKTDSDCQSVRPVLIGAGMPAPEVEAWFVREVLPLEAALMHYLQASYRRESDIADLRQDVYAAAIEAAHVQIPHRTRPFVFAIARNLMINRIRRDRVVPFETIADPDELGLAADEPAPDRAVMAREELRRLRAAIDQLPPRCREAVVLARVEELPGREIARRMGINETTVSHYIKRGMRVLADMLYGDEKPGGAP
jgi:RNA polymerase sigma factor (sigma-70 family)